MPKIKKLDSQEILKIAAGEVIERPFNTLKELLENSLDANATQISIYIEDGGKKLIRVIDNGTGMSEEDALLSIQHHTTSKIQTVHDLDKILTFGFRGEALSSITSVSKMTIITKEAISDTATELKIEAGNIVSKKQISSTTGTDIIIEDLFFNVPVRKKFLKTKETELRAIVQLFFAFCLSHLSVSFKLFSDKKLIYNCPATKFLEERLTQLYEEDLIGNIVSIINEDNTEINLTGVITKPIYNRYDRNQIFTFVNKRWVKNYKLTQAFIKAYQGSLQPNKYPAGILFLDIDPKEIDVNIHPKKEEIQFLHPKIIESLITRIVKENLDRSINQSLKAAQIDEVKQKTKFNNFSTDELKVNLNFTTTTPKIIETNSNNHKFDEIIDTYFRISQPLPKEIKSHEEIQLTEANTEVFKTTSSARFQIISQIFETYIIIQNANEIVLIDQHAAHERILFEKFKNQQNKLEGVNLITPQIITLQTKSLNLLEPYLEIFMAQGINAEIFAKDKIMIKSMPISLKNQSLEDIIHKSIILIEQNLDPKSLISELERDLLKQISCKGAVKAGDKLSHESMNQIINDLLTTENKLSCPHGRPTIWSISKDEIERKFKRDYRAKVYSTIFD